MNVLELNGAFCKIVTTHDSELHGEAFSGWSVNAIPADVSPSITDCNTNAKQHQKISDKFFEARSMASQKIVLRNKRVSVFRRLILVMEHKLLNNFRSRICVFCSNASKITEHNMAKDIFSQNHEMDAHGRFQNCRFFLKA